MASQAGAAAGGAAQGAVAGAAIGSAVPGIGTAVGTVGGAVIGGTIGWWQARKAEEERKKQAKADEKAAQEAAVLAGQQQISGSISEDRARSVDMMQRALDTGNVNVYAPEVRAQTIDAERADAARIDPVERVSAQDVAVPQLGNANMVYGRDAQFVESAPTQTATGAQIGGATINTVDSNAMRSRQVDFVDELGRVVRGEAPSVAQAQYAANQADSASKAMGIAAKARGTEAAAARREAMYNVAQGDAKANLDAALIRANEQAAARGQMGGALSDVRGTDVATATNQAQLTQGAQTTNATLATGVSQANAQAANARAMADAARQQDVVTGNVNRDVGVQSTNVGAQNQRQVDVANLAANVTQNNANRQLQAGTTNAQAANARATNNAQMQTQVNVGNADRSTNVSAQNAGNNLQAQTTNAKTMMDSQQTAITARQNAANMGIAASGQAADATKTAINYVQGEKAAANASKQTNLQERGQNMQLVGAGLNAAASVGGAYIAAQGKGSDVRLKTDIQRESDRDVDDFIDALDAYNYRYKDPAEGDGERHGIMAQDLERSAIGRDLVRRDENGMRRVDTDALTLALAGVVARKMKEGKR